MQCNIKVSRLRCYVKDYGEKKLDLLKYRRNCFFKYKLPKGIFIIQETEGALIAPKSMIRLIIKIMCCISVKITCNIL